MVSFKKLKKINVIGGDVLHALKKSDTNFKKFGEAYFSIVLPNVIKGWKLHTKMTCNLVVPIGNIKFVATKDITKFNVFEIGESNYGMLTIPPNYWFAFKCVSKTKSIILNISDFEHDPCESIKKDINEIKFNWS